MKTGNAWLIEGNKKASLRFRFLKGTFEVSCAAYDGTAHALKISVVSMESSSTLANDSYIKALLVSSCVIRAKIKAFDYAATSFISCVKIIVD